MRCTGSPGAEDDAFSFPISRDCIFVFGPLPHPTAPCRFLFLGTQLPRRGIEVFVTIACLREHNTRRRRLTSDGNLAPQHMCFPWRNNLNAHFRSPYLPSLRIHWTTKRARPRHDGTNSPSHVSHSQIRSMLAGPCPDADGKGKTSL
jgi:hypothetical protein